MREVSALMQAQGPHWPRASGKGKGKGKGRVVIVEIQQDGMDRDWIAVGTLLPRVVSTSSK